MSDRNSGEPFTVKDLREAIADMDDAAWVCLEGGAGGPCRAVLREPGANEPFVLLETGKDVSPPRRAAILRVDLQQLARIMRLPDGAKFECAIPGDPFRPAMIFLRVTSPTLPEIPEREMLPEIGLLVTDDGSQARSQFYTP